MARVALPIQTFTNAEGQPLSFGYITIRLNEDAKTPDPAQVCAQRIDTIQLDVNGTVIGSPAFWGNSVLVPAGTVYLLSSFTNQGLMVTYNVPITI